MLPPRNRLSRLQINDGRITHSQVNLNRLNGGNRVRARRGADVHWQTGDFSAGRVEVPEDGAAHHIVHFCAPVRILARDRTRRYFVGLAPLQTERASSGAVYHVADALHGTDAIDRGLKLNRVGVDFHQADGKTAIVYY